MEASNAVITQNYECITSVCHSITLQNVKPIVKTIESMFSILFISKSKKVQVRYITISDKPFFLY